MSHVGLEPTLAGLESAAQPLYQWPKYKYYIVYWYNKFKLCGVNWESNPIFHGCLPCVISYLIKNSVSRSYLKTIMLTNTHIDLSLYDLWNTTICLYHAIACQSYCIVVTYIRLTLTPWFCTPGRIRTYDNTWFGVKPSRPLWHRRIKSRKFTRNRLLQPYI